MFGLFLEDNFYILQTVPRQGNITIRRSDVAMINARSWVFSKLHIDNAQNKSVGRFGVFEGLSNCSKDHVHGLSGTHGPTALFAALGIHSFPPNATPQRD